MARFSKEKLALRGSIVILGAWVLFSLASPIADAIGEDAKLIFGILWILIFYGLALATLIFVPVFAGQAIRSLRSDDPARKGPAGIALALSVLSLALMLLYFGHMFL
ncbi:hypothetical protein [Corynebacterium lehmanniae]|uniref:DUF4190 domain-containing protein n=1 Tax=Corynebacterium lehmanniae TaxID=2913497 RepID=A0ABT4R837_9CORY|nr:hypothetical protein [Corynebacterium lehmanniae]MCZ9291715.1 hypothetical protein [Corynebacterium lehmanniae]